MPFGGVIAMDGVGCCGATDPGTPLACGSGCNLTRANKTYTYSYTNGLIPGSCTMTMNTLILTLFYRFGTAGNSNPYWYSGKFAAPGAKYRTQNSDGTGPCWESDFDTSERAIILRCNNGGSAAPFDMLALIGYPNLDCLTDDGTNLGWTAGCGFASNPLVSYGSPGYVLYSCSPLNVFISNGVPQKIIPPLKYQHQHFGYLTP